MRLTEPITHDGETLPGWWTETGPSGRPDDRFPGGHANNGMAHGIGGVLALLALAARRGITVRRPPRSPAHDPGLAGPLAAEHRPTATGVAVLGHPRRAAHGPPRAPSAPRRPSWCYGTAGLARAQQLAALALGDANRQIDAENALVAALTDPEQLKATTDNGLCHGFAGLAHIAARVGRRRPPLDRRTAPRRDPGAPGRSLPRRAPTPKHTATALIQDEEAGPGFLDGAAGIALALLAPSTTAPPRSAWDACLLIA